MGRVKKFGDQLADIHGDGGGEHIVRYEADPTIMPFHASDAPRRGLMGPLGSGKSSACVMEIVMRAFRQRPWKGRRISRWLAIRNTYPELETSTIKIWQEWVPEEIAPIKWSHPIQCRLQRPLSDGTVVDLEVYFIALDREEDVGKLLSTNVTAAWINEAREVPRKVATDIYDRTRRYPPPRWGGFSWGGMIMDTNPPPEDSWYHEWAEEIDWGGRGFFHRQPGALVKNPDGSYSPNPAATYHRFQAEGYQYWLDMVPAHTEDWLNVMVLGNYGLLTSGQPVYPEYNERIHVSDSRLMPDMKHPLLLGWDFELSPGCIVAQLLPGPQLRILAEIHDQRTSLTAFVRDKVRPVIEKMGYTPKRTMGWGDPASGARHDQIDFNTVFDILMQMGFYTEPAPSNLFQTRREAVARMLTRINKEGEPAILIDPHCSVLRDGFKGKYHYKEQRRAGGSVVTDLPEKTNPYSAVQDALQYLVLGAVGINQDAQQEPMMNTGASVTQKGVHYVE